MDPHAFVAWKSICEYMVYYCLFSNTRRTQSQNINVSRIVLQLFLPNPLKPSVKLRVKMKLEQRRQAMLQLHEWATILLLT